MWTNTSPTGWVRRLIPAVGTFVGTLGPSVITDYWSMQLLSGHGAFQRFKHRIVKAPSEVCLDCGAARDGRCACVHIVPGVRPPARGAGRGPWSPGGGAPPLWAWPISSKENGPVSPRLRERLWRRGKGRKWRPTVFCGISE